jgi:tRNA (guanine37-N1)-methyltransferase
MLKIDIITLFPKMFENSPLNQSVMWRAQDKGFLEINIVDLKKYGLDERKTVDDRPYGGGAGMLLRVDVIDNALKDLGVKPKTKNQKIIITDARGETYKQSKAYEYSKLKRLTIICGHYEGIDHRVHEHLVDDIISIGDYVLTGGEIPAMVITDSVTRLIPGVIKDESLKEESFSMKDDITTEYPQYTRPPIYNGWNVPDILLTGNHPEIEKWRKKNDTIKNLYD